MKKVIVLALMVVAAFVAFFVTIRGPEEVLVPDVVGGDQREGRRHHQRDDPDRDSPRDDGAVLVVDAHELDARPDQDAPNGHGHAVRRDPQRCSNPLGQQAARRQCQHAIVAGG